MYSDAPVLAEKAKDIPPEKTVKYYFVFIRIVMSHGCETNLHTADRKGIGIQIPTSIPY